MSAEPHVQPCAECGWPALAETRRCPYCRVRMPRAARARTLTAGTEALRWLIVLWFGAMAVGTLLALAVLGWPAALGAAALAFAPVLFVYVLDRRSAYRIRALNGGRLSGRHRLPGAPGRSESNSPNSPSDVGRN